MGKEITLANLIKTRPIPEVFLDKLTMLSSKYGSRELDIDWYESLIGKEIKFAEFRRRFVEGSNPNVHHSEHFYGKKKSDEGDKKFT